jgi:uncharacterized membrane protein
VFCIWCFISTVSIMLCLVLAWLDWRRVNRSEPTPPERTRRLPIAA